MPAPRHSRCAPTSRPRPTAPSPPPDPPGCAGALDRRDHCRLHCVVPGATHAFQRVVVITPGASHDAATAHGVVVATVRKSRMAAQPALCYRRGMKSAPGAGIAIGVAIGVAMGVALHDIGLGIVLGAAFGAAFEGALGGNLVIQNTGEAIKRGEE